MNEEQRQKCAKEIDNLVCNYHHQEVVDAIAKVIAKYDEPFQPEHPAPAPLPLCEAVESVLSYLQVGGDRGNPPLSDRIRTMRISLAAEVKRQEAMDKVIEAATDYVRAIFMGQRKSTCFEALENAVKALDALEGGGR